MRPVLWAERRYRFDWTSSARNSYQRKSGPAGDYTDKGQSNITRRCGDSHASAQRNGDSAAHGDTRFTNRDASAHRNAGATNRDPSAHGASRASTSTDRNTSPRVRWS